MWWWGWQQQWQQEWEGGKEVGKGNQGGGWRQLDIRRWKWQQWWRW